MNFSSKLLLACSVLALAACDSSSNKNRDFKLQVLHASADAPAVNVLIDGTEVLSGVDYKVGSGQLTNRQGTYTVQVDGILPAGLTPVIGPVDLAFDRKMIYTIAAVNNVANIEPVVISQPDEEVSAGSARLFVLHGVPGPLLVDVYVTTPGADLSATAPTGTFDFKETLGPVEVAAGDYQVRITAAGSPGVVAYDSGTVTLSDGADLVLAAVPNASSATAVTPGVSLVGLTGSGSVEFLDVNTPTALRVGHLSPDTGPVDVVVNGGTFLNDVPFPAVTGFTPLDPATYNVAVTDGTNPGVVAIGPVDLELAAGTWYSVLAVDEFANIEPLILTDDPRPVATNAKVRVIHAAPAAPEVDVYVTAVGADINNETATLPSFAFKANTGYLALPAGDYDVTVTGPGSKQAVIGPAMISIDNGGVYTAIARNPLPGATEPGLIVLADALND